jgi:hypothetical protein
MEYCSHSDSRQQDPLAPKEVPHFYFDLGRSGSDVEPHASTVAPIHARDRLRIDWPNRASFPKGWSRILDSGLSSELLELPVKVPFYPKTNLPEFPLFSIAVPSLHDRRHEGGTALAEWGRLDVSTNTQVAGYRCRVQLLAGWSTWPIWVQDLSKLVLLKTAGESSRDEQNGDYSRSQLSPRHRVSRQKRAG